MRNDYLHKASTAISKNHAVVSMEDLQVKNMTKSVRGTVENPGSNVKAKSGLNRAIVDQGWGELKRQFGYKSVWQGGVLVLVPAKYTSQNCCECGQTEKGNRTTQAVFQCRACGHQDNADTNAAKNILGAGLALLACGDAGLHDCSTKQELRSRLAA
jgi:putative transposase